MMPPPCTPTHQVGRDFPNNTKNAIRGHCGFGDLNMKQNKQTNKQHSLILGL
jgi:hypothetical protein